MLTSLPPLRGQVRCCSTSTPVQNSTEGDQYPWTKNAGCSVWGGSDEGSNWHCSKNKTFAEAEAICQAANARLCTTEELVDGCTAGTGCGFDWQLVWAVPLPPPPPTSPSPPPPAFPPIPAYATTSSTASACDAGFPIPLEASCREAAAPALGLAFVATWSRSDRPPGCYEYNNPNSGGLNGLWWNTDPGIPCTTTPCGTSGAMSMVYKTCGLLFSPPSPPSPSPLSLEPVVTLVEPWQKAYYPLHFPGGSPWCSGKPTYWWTGHHAGDPFYCEESEGVWVQGQPYMSTQDRHGCGVVDVDQDGVDDVICAIGGGRGGLATSEAPGVNEVYLTQPNGSLSRVWNHGLDRKPWTRGRYVYPLKAYDGEQLVFITVDMGPLATGAEYINDGLRKNHNDLYRRVPKQADGAYFVLLNMTVFEEELSTEYVEVSDYDGDGVDDLFVAARTGHGYRNARIYLQNKTNGHFVRTELPKTANFQHVKIIDVNGDGRSDMFVSTRWDHRLRLFEGIAEFPYFDFDKPLVHWDLGPPPGSPSFTHLLVSFAVFDVNGDGLADVYVVQSLKKDHHEGCFGGHDFILVRDSASELTWTATDPQHNLSGCAAYVEPFGDAGVALSHGTKSERGNNYLLRWNTPAQPVSPPIPHSQTAPWN